MPVPLPIIMSTIARLGELASRLFEAGRTEATDEEVDAATQRRKGALSDLEKELARRKAEEENPG